LHCKVEVSSSVDERDKSEDDGLAKSGKVGKKEEQNTFRGNPH
jgi:hypothetical protein